MLYRLTAAAIVVFWLLMTALLVNTALFPDSRAAWLAVPPAHITSIIFQHGTDSELGIHDAEYKLGSIRLTPKHDAQSGNSLHLVGDLLLRLPVLSRQRIAFRGNIALGPAYDAQALDLEVNLREPPVNLRINASSIDNSYHYSIDQEGYVLTERKGSIADLLNESAGLLGSPGDILQLKPALEQTRVTARRGKLAIKGDEIDVFQITIHHASDLRSEISVSPVGRVLLVTTPFGYRLMAEGLEP